MLKKSERFGNFLHFWTAIFDHIGTCIGKIQGGRSMMLFFGACFHGTILSMEVWNMKKGHDSMKVC
jgi:hypothetical protein